MFDLEISLNEKYKLSIMYSVCTEYFPELGSLIQTNF